MSEDFIPHSLKDGAGGATSPQVVVVVGAVVEEVVVVLRWRRRGMTPHRASRVMMSIGSATSISSETASFVRSPPVEPDAVSNAAQGSANFCLQCTIRRRKNFNSFHDKQ